MTTKEYTKADRINFIASIYSAAVKVSSKTGLSVELMLAQAAEETGWGAKVFEGSYKLFGIKADRSWTGPYVEGYTHEVINGVSTSVIAKFRVFTSYEDALQQRADFLLSNPRYNGILEQGTLGDYAKEAVVLQSAGYATNPNYATNLIGIVSKGTLPKAILFAQAQIEQANLTSPTTSDFDLHIDPSTLDIQTTTPITPAQSISSTNNTLLSGGGYSVTGVGDVNVASQIDAWFNNSITANLRPGADQLAQVSPAQSFAQMIEAPFSAPAISNAFNNYNFGLNFYTPTDPLILDLNGDGAHLTDYGSNPVLFDIDHDGGTLEQTGWVSPEDGMAVYDLNGNGKIDDISETLSEYFNGEKDGVTKKTKKRRGQALHLT